MKARNTSLILCAARYAALTTLACAALPASADVAPVIAKGGTIELSVSDVRSLVAALPEQSRTALHGNLPALEQLIRQEIVQRALQAEVQAKNFAKDPAAVKQLERLQQQALLQLYVASQTSAPADYPNEAEVSKVYDQIRAQSPREYHLAQIFISTPDGADPAKLSAALRKAMDVAAKVQTADFAQLAREQSEQSETAAKGGDLGFVTVDRMPADVLKIVSSLSPGQVAGPVKTPDGLHFVKLIETRPVTLPPLAQVHGQIVADLRARRSQELQRAYLNSVATKLGISVNEIELSKLLATLN